MKKMLLVFTGFILTVCIVGCSTQLAVRYKGDYPFKDPEWVRSGEPIMFEDDAWYPTDTIENLLDNEVILMGNYRQTPFYVERRDVKPINRIYTKFGYHKYRVFSKDSD